MKSEVVFVSPSMAAEWLTHVNHAKQRKLNQRLVRHYAAIMTAGQWVLTHQGIAFDVNGNLADGQHRLQAVVESGVSVSMVVTRELPEKQGDIITFDAIDRGWNRNIATQLQLHGIENATRMAGAARCIAMMCCRTGVKMTVPNTLFIIEEFGASMKFAHDSMTNAVFRVSPVIGGLAFCHRVMPQELQEFVISVGNGENLTRGMPAFALRAFLMTNGRLEYYIERACALCAMHHVSGGRVLSIKNTAFGVNFFSEKQWRTVDKVRAMFGTTLKDKVF